MKGSGTGTPTLSADLQMNMSLNNGIENRYLEGWDLFGVCVQSTTPGVGNSLQAWLRNPKTSGVIASVTRAAWAEGTATNSSAAVNSQFFVGPSGTNIDQNTLATSIGWDGRGRPSSSLIVSSNSAAPGASSGIVRVAVGSAPAFTPVEFITPGLEIPLTPGAIMIMDAGNLNSGASWWYWWRERALEDSEKF